VVPKPVAGRRRWRAIGLLLALVAVVCTTAPRPAAAQAQPLVVISEFLAINANTVPDVTGEFEDWIELHNTASVATDIAGWTLADGDDSYTFPAGTSLAANDYLLVFASGAPERSTASETHLPFKLSSVGEPLTLRDDAGQLSSPGWPAPGYPAQTPDISYGVDGAGNNVWFASPSPGAPNDQGATGVVGAVSFSLPHGFYSGQQVLALNTPTPGATIRYTLDGSTPTPTNGEPVAPGASLDVTSTSNVRAVAYRAGWITSPVETRSYLFVGDIANQDETTPPGWPDHLGVNDHHFYYGFDADLDAAGRQAVADALVAVPSISITTDLENLFDPATGIYVNPLERGSEWEREASIELIDPTGAEPGFDINGGLRIRGNSSRNVNNPKHSLRFFFRNEYGDGRLEYPLFGVEGFDSFAKVDLRTAQSWSWQRTVSTREGRGDASTWLRDVWNRDTQGAMGQAYTRSRSYHLYLNGQYWGIYETEERVSDEYGADYFGGSENDYDVIKRLTGAFTAQATEGTYDGWASLWPIVSDLQVNDQEYAVLDGLVDLENLADYYLLHFFGGDGDGAPRRTLTVANNWLAFRNRQGVGGAGKWSFIDRDSESALCHSTPTENQAIAPDIDVTPPWSLTVETNAAPEFSMHPGYLHEALITHPAYVQLFQDRVQLHMLTPGGAMTIPEMEARFEARYDVVETMIDAEAARWGDSVIEPGFDRSDWLTATETLRNCFAFRTTITQQQLTADGLWPLSEPPVVDPTSGPVAYGTPATVDAAGQSGTLYVTTDGTDPRAADGSVSATAFVYGGAIPITADQTIRARLRDGTAWSPVASATYTLASTAGPPSVLLNEFNAVSSSQYLGGGSAGDVTNGSDLALGRVLGNGGDWIELVVLEEGADLRGYTFEISHLEDGVRSTSGSLTLRNRAIFTGLHAGTIITISEDLPDDLSYNPPAGDWHINLQSNDQLDGAHITTGSQSDFVVNNDDTHVTIWDGDGTLAALPTGEGTAPGVAVNSREVFKLEATPTIDILPTFDGYQDGTSSSWGLANQWNNGATTQDLAPLRIEFGDVNCDDRLNVTDALMIAQFQVGLRTASSCPLPDTTSIYLPAADVNQDNVVNVTDALLIAQCTVGNPNTFCPNGN